MAHTLYATQNVACEWAHVSGKPYSDPFNQVELDVLFSGPEGCTYRVPTYWAGEQEWRVRFAAPEPGEYTYRTICSDAKNPSLHNQTGRLIVSPYKGDNPLLAHGPLRIDATHRYLEHADGTPFFWLGDTWWMGLTTRCTWPDEFQLLTADRVSKRFSVIQIVAGLYPDMPAYDPRGFNEAGHPWEPEYARIRPAYFDMADLRIRWLVREGLVPCILGCWGYHLPWLGVTKMKQHWRYLVARYSAYPVVWCLAGETAMPYYLSADRDNEIAMQRRGWTEVGRYLRTIDGMGRPITTHPTRSGRDQVEDDTVLDANMLQTGHGGYESIGNTVGAIRAAVEREPTMPVIESEVCYEGILAGSGDEIQRIVFWASFLSGAKGYTYGADGLWQLNRPEHMFGPSPHGMTWGDTPWMEAYRLPGSTHIGIGKRLLERYEWWRFKAHPEWVNRHASQDAPLEPYAAGIPGQVRLIYLPRPLRRRDDPVIVRVLDPSKTYHAYYYDTKKGFEHDLGTFGNVETWLLPLPSIARDWVLVIETLPN